MLKKGGMAAKTFSQRPKAEFEGLVAQEVRSEGCAGGDHGVPSEDKLVSHTLRVVTQCEFRDDFLVLMDRVFIFVEGSVYSENVEFRTIYTVKYNFRMSYFSVWPL